MDIPLTGEFGALAFDFRLQDGLSFVTGRAPDVFVVIFILNHPVLPGGRRVLTGSSSCL